MLALVRFAPQDKVLDLGCGYGLVGIYAARIIPPERVTLLDNDPLAIATAGRNLAINGIAGARLVLSDGFRGLTEAGFTQILCNPPYHADFSVPKHFIEKSFNRLTLGGTLWMVTRRDTWYRNKLRAIFGGVRTHVVKPYFVFEATRTALNYANRPQS